MRLKPVNDKIVVKENEKKDNNKTESGIILPDTANDNSLLEGKVVAVSDGMYSATGTLIPCVVTEGDTILYGKHVGKTEYKIDNETFIIMSVNEIQSILKEK